MFKILQVNLGRARAAHDLMWATAVKEGIDVVVISEPNKRICAQRGWITDMNGDMAVAIMNNRVEVDNLKKKKAMFA